MAAADRGFRPGPADAQPSGTDKAQVLARKRQLKAVTESRIDVGFIRPLVVNAQSRLPQVLDSWLDAFSIAIPELRIFTSGTTCGPVSPLFRNEDTRPAGGDGTLPDRQ